MDNCYEVNSKITMKNSKLIDKFTIFFSEWMKTLEKKIKVIVI